MEVESHQNEEEGEKDHQKLRAHQNYNSILTQVK